jgi:hypothetical protein
MKLLGLNEFRGEWLGDPAEMPPGYAARLDNWELTAGGTLVARRAYDKLLVASGASGAKLNSTNNPITFLGQFAPHPEGFVVVGKNANGQVRFYYLDESPAGNFTWKELQLDYFGLGERLDTNNRFFSLHTARGYGWLYHGAGRERFVGSGNPEDMLIALKVNYDPGASTPLGTDEAGYWQPSLADIPTVSAISGGANPVGYYTVAYTLVFWEFPDNVDGPFYRNESNLIASVGWQTAQLTSTNKKLRVSLPAVTEPDSGLHTKAGRVIGRNLYIAYSDTGFIAADYSNASLFRLYATPDDIPALAGYGGTGNIDIDIDAYKPLADPPPFSGALPPYRDHTLPPWHSLYTTLYKSSFTTLTTYSGTGISTVHDRRLMAAVNVNALHLNRLVWSNKDNFNTWPLLNYMDIGDAQKRITGLRSHPQGLIVWKEREGVYLVTGWENDTPVAYGPIVTCGLEAPDALVEFEGRYYWPSVGYGIVSWAIGQPVRIESQSLEPLWSKYMTYAFPSPSTTSSRSLSYMTGFAAQGKLYFGYAESYSVRGEKFKVGFPSLRDENGEMPWATMSGNRGSDYYAIQYTGRGFKTQLNTEVQSGDIISAGSNLSDPSNELHVWHDEVIDFSHINECADGDISHPVVPVLETGEMSADDPRAKKLWTDMWVETGMNTGANTNSWKVDATQDNGLFDATLRNDTFNDGPTRKMHRVQTISPKAFYRRAVRLTATPTGTGSRRPRLLQLVLGYETLDPHGEGP